MTHVIVGVAAGRSRRAPLLIVTLTACAAFALVSETRAAFVSETRAELVSETRAKALFLTGVWSTSEGCTMRAAILGGGPKNVETAPELLTAEGYEGWERGCAFSSVKQQGKGRWTVKTSCNEGAEEWQDTETWELDAAGTQLKVTVEDKTTEFVRCDAGKGN